MRHAVSTRQNNNDATLDARDDQVAKTNQRAVSRSQRIPGRMLAYIAWNLTGAGVDTSLGVICDENGNSTLATIQIDAIASIVNCQPQSFGYALYEVTIVGTRSNAPTYAATKVSSIAPASGLGTAKSLGGINSSYQLLDSSSALIQVTVGGVATNSVLPSYNTVPLTVAAGTPISYVLAGSVNFAVSVSAGSVYGIIQWNYTETGGDLSQCEICHSDGSRITSPTIGAIDFLTSIRPQAFGNIAYKLEAIGTRSSKTLYRAIEVAAIPVTGGSSPAVAGRGLTSAGAGAVDANGGYVYSGPIGSATSYAAITTTINGTAVDNYLPVLVPDSSGSSGIIYDLPSPLQWTLSGVVTGPGVAFICLVPAIVCTHRLGCSTQIFDVGETVVFHFTGGFSFTGGNIDFSGTLIVKLGATSYSGLLTLRFGGFTSASAHVNNSSGAAIPATAYGSTVFNVNGYGNVALTLTLSGGKLTSPTWAVSGLSGGAVFGSAAAVVVGGQNADWAGVG